jgi:hypothetical protein
MKKLCILVVILVRFSAFAQVGIATTNPNAQLDIRSSNQSSPSVTDGLLIPKIDTFPANPGSDQQGMLIYLTTTSGSKSPGFYYWDFPTLSWTGMSSTTSNDINITNFEDFIFDSYSGSGSNDNQYAFTQSTSGGTSDIDGIANSYLNSNDYMGIHRLSVSTSGQRAALGSSNYVNRIKVGSKPIIYEMRVKFAAAYTSGQNYTAYLGLSDLASAAAASTMTNGLYFRLTVVGTTATLVGAANSASVTPTITSSRTISANTWYKFKAIVSASGATEFYVDDVKFGTISSGYPPSTNGMKFVFNLEKNLGSTAVTCDIDYITWKMTR